MKYVTVYAGSVDGSDPAFVESAKELGRCLLKHKIGVVYGSGSFGMMGAVAETVDTGGGSVIGVIPQFFLEERLEAKVGAKPIGERFIVQDMHERKRQMAEKGDGFIALPGGIGTLEELTEIITWTKLKLINKPIGILNINKCYDGFLKWAHDSLKNGFISADVIGSFIVSDNAADLVDKMIDIYKTKSANDIIDDGQLANV